MATVIWQGGTGYWDTDRWSGTTTYPSATDQVYIDTYGSVVNIIDPAYANTVNLTVYGANLNVESELTLSGTGASIHVNSGYLTLYNNGSITGGSLYITGSTLTNGGSIDLLGGLITLNDGFLSILGTGAIADASFSLLNGSYLYIGKQTTISNGNQISLTSGQITVAYQESITGGMINIYGGTFLNQGATNLSLGQVLRINSNTANTGTFFDYNSLNLAATATLDLISGYFVLTSNTQSVGSVNGGIIAGNSNIIHYDGGVLNAVTFETTMYMNGGVANIINSLTLTGAGGTGPGLADISTAALNFESSQTLNNAAINLDYGRIFLTDSTSLGDQILTLGANLVINTLGGNNFIATQQSIVGEDITPTGPQVVPSDSVLNEGVINVTAGALYDDALNFTNKGTINVTGGIFTLYLNFANASGGSINISGSGAQLTLGAGDTGYRWSNAGAIAVGAGGLLTLKGNISNTGTITVASGGELALYTGLTPPSTIILSNGTALDLHGAETTAQVENFVGATFTKVRIYGALNNAGQDLSIGVGSQFSVFTLQTGGVITGGTITAVGSGVSFAGGALNGVTWRGLMDLSAAHSGFTVQNGLTVTGAGGTGAGVINLTGATSYIAFQGTQTLNNVTINLGSATGGATQALDITDPTALDDQTLTLGAGVVIDVAGQADEIGDFQPGDTTDGVVNDGAINAGAAGGVLTEDVYNFTNDGAINVGNGQIFNADYNFTNAAGATLAIMGAGTTLALASSGGAYGWSNAGTITVGAGGILTLYGAYTNTGTIALASGATLNLRGTATTAQIEAATTAGGALVNIFGSLTNTGATLTVGPGAGPGKLTMENGSAIVGGVIKDTGGGIVCNGLTLNGVTYEGTMDLSAPSSSVTIVGGLTATTLSGTGAGTINVTGVGGDIYFQGTQTFDNATINLGSQVGHGDYLYESDPTHLGDQTLTLGSGAVVNALGYYESIGTQDTTGTDSIVNDGAINATYAGGYLYETAASFTNAGVIKIRNGESFYAYDTFTNTGTLSLAGTGSVAYLAYNGAPYSFTNLVGGTLTGGIYQVGAGDTLYLPAAVSVLKADLTLTGAGSVVEANPSGPTIDQSLTEIGAGGMLRLASGRDFVASNTVTIDAGGRLYGAGTFTGALIDNGALDIEGGTLAITGAVTGAGTGLIGANATLEFGAAANTKVTFLASSTLALDDSAAFTGKLSGFTGGDRIDVKDIAYSGGSPSFTEDASNTFGTLTIGSGAHMASIILFGQYIAADFHAASDGATGQLISYTPPAPAAISPPGS